MKVSRLLKSEARLTKEELKGFKKGDLITGNDVNPEELKRWTGEGCREKALEELKKFNSSYYIGKQLADVTEYAVETYEAGESGAAEKVKSVLENMQKYGELEKFDNLCSSDTQPARNLFSCENDSEAELTLIFEYK